MKRLSLGLFLPPKYSEVFVFVSTRRWQSLCLNIPHSQQRMAECQMPDMVLVPWKWESERESLYSWSSPIPADLYLFTIPVDLSTALIKHLLGPATVLSMNCAYTGSCSFSCLPIEVKFIAYLWLKIQLQILMLAFTETFSMKLVKLLDLLNTLILQI